MRLHKILLVDNNLKDMELTIRILNKLETPNEVTVATNGEKALEQLLLIKNTNNSNPYLLPDLVLLNLRLPRIDGLEVLKEVRSHMHTRLLPVVVLTSSNKDRDRIMCYHLGANSYIQKPINFETFKQTIEICCKYWLEYNKSPFEYEEVM